MTIDDLPRDIIIRIISFDLYLAPTIYKLNRRLHDIFYFDPNFREYVNYGVVFTTMWSPIQLCGRNLYDSIVNVLGGSYDYLS